MQLNNAYLSEILTVKYQNTSTTFIRNLLHFPEWNCECFFLLCNVRFYLGLMAADLAKDVFLAVLCANDSTPFLFMMCLRYR